VKVIRGPAPAFSRRVFITLKKTDAICDFLPEEEMALLTSPPVPRDGMDGAGPRPTS
jgi:hypothetical protein